MQLTLDQAWTECIKMWEWVVAESMRRDDIEVEAIKREYVQTFKPSGYQNLNITTNCYFCTYSVEQDAGLCKQCPGKMIDKDFECVGSVCTSRDSHVAFLAKIKDLHAMYLIYMESM